MPLRASPLPDDPDQAAKSLKAIKEMPAPGSTHSAELPGPPTQVIVPQTKRVAAEIIHTIAAIDARRQ